MKLGALVVGLVVAASSVPAQAGGRRQVVVLEIDASPGVAKAVGKVVEAVVSKKHTLLARSEYLKAVKMAKPAVGADAHNRAAAAVRADVVIEGRVAERAGRKTLILQVRSGKTGELVDATYVPVKGKGIDARGQAALEEELLQMIAWVEPLPADVTDRVPVKRMPEPEMEAEAEAEAEPEETFGTTREEEVVVKGPRMDAEASAGLAVVGRQLTFAVQEGVPDAMQPRNYDGSPVGGAQIGGELYPLLRRGGHLARVGVGGSYERAMGVTSKAMIDGMPQEFATTQQRMDLGLRYRMPLGKLTATVGVGYQRVLHHIDSGGVALGLPDVDYRCLDLGLTVRAPVAKKWSVGVGGRYLRPLGAGEIMEADAYGAGTAQGYVFDASVAYRIRPRLFVRAGLDYMKMALAFDGSGAMTDVDGDVDKDVGGAADTWTGGHVTVGMDL
jgi:hypothetical protein